MCGKLGFQQRDYHMHLTDLSIPTILPIDHALFLFLLLEIAVIVILATFSSKLILLNDEKNFVANISFNVNYFILIWSWKYRIWYYKFWFRKGVLLIWSNYGIMKRTETTCKKIPSYICATQLAGGVLLKKLKKIRIILTIFEFSLGVRNSIVLIGLCK